MPRQVWGVVTGSPVRHLEGHLGQVIVNLNNPHCPDHHQHNYDPGDNCFGDHFHYQDNQQHDNDPGDQITCVRLFGPLLATGTRGAERAVRIWKVQVNI